MYKKFFTFNIDHLKFIMSFFQLISLKINKVNLFSLFHSKAKELQGSRNTSIKIANASTTVDKFYKMHLNKHVLFATRTANTQC